MKSMASLRASEYVVATGGGPGVMEAGNRGAADAGGASIGLNVVLPHEQAPNEYVTPGLCFNFHYFGIRKMHFLMRARAICVFPGGFGTLDETFEALTLIQTDRMKRVPFLLFGESFWRRIINWEGAGGDGYPRGLGCVLTPCRPLSACGSPRSGLDGRPDSAPARPDSPRSIPTAR